MAAEGGLIGGFVLGGDQAEGFVLVLGFEGFLFFGYYVLYTIFLVLSIQKSELLSNFTIGMVWFVFPLTILTLLILLYRESRKKAD